MCANNGVWSNELGVLDGDDEIVSPDFLPYFEGLTVQLEYFDRLHSCIPQSIEPL